jgi:hypothetical protein
MTQRLNNELLEARLEYPDTPLTKVEFPKADELLGDLRKRYAHGLPEAAKLLDAIVAAYWMEDVTSKTP